MPPLVIGLCGLALLATACACASTPAAFSTTFPDNQPGDARALQQRIDQSARPSAPPPIVVGAAPGRLFGYDVKARRLAWQRALPLDSVPLLAGDAVVVQSGGSVLGLDLRSGASRFSASRSDMALRGASGSGPRAVVMLRRGSGLSARSEVLLFDGASLRWRHAIPGAGGVPAVAGDVVLVPWNTQFLSALDAKSGDEFARIRVRDGVIAQALVGNDGAYLGSAAELVPLRETLATGRFAAPGRLVAPALELPGRPHLLGEVYGEANPVRLDSAEHRIGLVFAPRGSRNGRLGLSDDTLYYYFYRLVFALDPRSGAVRWVHVHPLDVVGATAQAGGLAIADERGQLDILSAASGKVEWSARSGMRATVARWPAGAAAQVAGGTPLDASARRQRLVEAIRDPDARLAPARVFATAQLAELPGPEVTRDLVALCDSDPFTPSVRDRACIELQRRHEGTDAMLAVLRRHASYLDGTTSPPVGALANAAKSLGLHEASPLLVEHLHDPATRSSDLPALVGALAQLGDPNAFAPLARFLALYHADAVDTGLVQALDAAPAALIDLGGPAARVLLTAIADDESAIYSVRVQARSALDELARRDAAAAAKREAEQTKPPPPPTPDQAAEAEPTQSAGPPPRLTPALVDRVLRNARSELAACFDEHRSIAQARVLLIVDSGAVKTVSVLPAELQDCVEPPIRAQVFPTTTAPQPERVSYTLHR